MGYEFWKRCKQRHPLPHVSTACDLNHTEPRSYSGGSPSEGLQCGALFNLGGVMKQWAWILAVPVLISLAVAQTQTSESSGIDRNASPPSSGIWHEAGPND